VSLFFSDQDNESSTNGSDVTKMQYELLAGEFDDHNTTASAVDLIKNMADGTGARHTDALKFGLREGFSLPRPKPPQTIPPAPFLFGGQQGPAWGGPFAQRLR